MSETATTTPAPAQPKAPAAPPNEPKKVPAVPGVEPTKGQVQPPSTTPPGDLPSVPKPAEGEAPPPAAEEPQAAPESILFDLELEDGTKKEVTASEAAKAIALTDKAVEIIENGKRLEKQHHDLVRKIVQKPLETALDLIAAVGFKGDRDGAFQYLMQQIRSAAKAEDDFQALPPEERIRIEYERKLKERDERLKKLQAEKESEAEALRQADLVQKIKVRLDKAISETQLPDLEEVRDRILTEVKRQRTAGRKANFGEAARVVKAHLETREEALLKATPIERLRQIRPDLAEAMEKDRLAQVTKAREEETAKKSSPPAREPQEEKSHRKPISRWSV